MDKPYADLVAQAEAAVSAVVDAELRRVAFEKILNDLLSDRDQSASGGAVAKPEGKSSGRRKRKAAVTPGRSSLRGGPTGYLSEMIDDGFFAKVKTMGEVKAELENRGHHIPFTSLSGPLQKLCQTRKLRRQKMDRGGKKSFGYSNW
jgi:hypothetical protein